MKIDPPPLGLGEVYSTVNGRFLHRGVNLGPDGWNTPCNALGRHAVKPIRLVPPRLDRVSLYGLQEVTRDQASEMHVCGKCWK